MKKLLMITVVAGLGWAWQAGKLDRWLESGAYDANGMSQVLVFTFQGCGKACDDALQGLNRRGVQYTQKIVQQDDSDPNLKLCKNLGCANRFPFIVAGSEKMAGYQSHDLMRLLAKSTGEQYLTAAEKKYFARHFYADGEPRVVMYSAEWCGYCRKLRQEMVDAGQDFLEIDVEKQADQQKLTRVMGIPGYPYTWVGYERVPGSSYSDVRNVLSKW